VGRQVAFFNPNPTKTTAQEFQRTRKLKKPPTKFNGSSASCKNSGGIREYGLSSDETRDVSALFPPALEVTELHIVNCPNPYTLTQKDIFVYHSVLPRGKGLY